VGIAAASFVPTVGIGAAGDLAEAAGSSTEDVATIVNLITTAEMLAVTFYYATLTGATFHIHERAVESLTVAMDAEMRHLDTLRSLNGRSMRDHFYLPDRMLSDARVFVNTGVTIETTLAGAYVAATRQFAVRGRPLLAATAALHAASAAQRLTLIGHLAGLPAQDLTMSTPAFHHVSDAARALAPFFVGGTGFSGPIGFPSARQYGAAHDVIMVERM